MSWIKDAIIGSDGKLDWDALKKMMGYEQQLNKTNRMGAFTGWAWDTQKDAEGNVMINPETGQPELSNTQRMTVHPDFQDAVDRLGARATAQSMPSGMNDLWKAKMANQMQRHGLDNSAYLPPAPPGNTTQIPPGGDGGGYV